MWFPQTGIGSIAQFPLQRSRNWRAITNILESGERIVLPDAAGGQIGWQLSYQDLSDAEAATLSQLFTASQGCFGSFTFIDPLANLLGWSEDLSRPDWQAGLLTRQTGVDDPMGTQRAWAVSNGTAGTQTLGQTPGVSGDYIGCFSTYIRSSAPGTITLARDDHQVTVETGPLWKRVFVTGAGAAGAPQSTFSIGISAGQTVDVWGLQVEAQPYPSAYKPTAAALGIYEDTYFGMDELKMTSDGPGRSSCSIILISRA